MADAWRGLSTEEARRRLGLHGANVMPEAPTGVWQRAISRFWAPVPWMLEAAIVLQFILREYAEAAVIALLLIFNAVLGLLQEGRAQATLDALKSRLALSALVCRDGVWRTLAAGELVPGDIVKLTLGGIVPADVRLLAGAVLLDQSMLTGESLPLEAGPARETYAGALVRRGEAVAEVTATGCGTKFGKTAQLVSIAGAVSSQQQAVLRVVRNLALFSGCMVAIQSIYAAVTGIPGLEAVPLILTAVLAAIPVALPATFTLASALGARTLASRGVLPTRLSAIDEAGTMNVLCSDKTGTLTQNALIVAAVLVAPGHDEAQLLGLATLASAAGALDPVDKAICEASARRPAAGLPERMEFVPFDPARKMSEARCRDAAGHELHVVKGAFARIAEISAVSSDLTTAATGLEKQGYRVLGVASGTPGALSFVGLIGLSDPPRSDAKDLIAELGRLGVGTVMITGDAAATATVVARAVGLDGAVCPAGPVPERAQPGDFAVFAGVFPEDKYRIVRAFQRSGHTVGMCGDGANDAPALRQAQIGIAVATATDVAKAAAGMVLTQPGLGGIVEAVRAGRIAYQRILTYTLRSITAKISQMLFLTAGLLLTGHAVLTPMLMVLLMISGDFLAMSATTDHVRMSPQPNAWRIGRVTLAAAALGICNVAFCTTVLQIARLRFGLTTGAGLRTMAAVIMVFSTQALFYVVRDRRHLWSSRPSRWVIVSSLVDVAIICGLAGFGLLMHALPWPLIGILLAGFAAFALVLDLVKHLLFERLDIR